MPPDALVLAGEARVEGRLDCLVHSEPPDFEVLLAELQAEKEIDRQLDAEDAYLAERRRTAPRRKAPWRWRARNWLRMLVAGEHFVPLTARVLRLIPGVTVCYGTLQAVVYKADENVVYDYGVVGYHLVTTAGKNFLASTLDNTAEPEILKYHGYGTGTSAAAAGDTALQTELSTQYATDSTRPTGSQAHSTNTYTTAATLTPDSGGTIAVTEWGLLSQAATGGGTLLDHQVFSAINLVGGSGDSLTTTYTFTIS